MRVNSAFVVSSFTCAFLYTLSRAQDSSYIPCPILGPRYPLPSQISSAAIIQEALNNLTSVLDSLAVAGNSSEYTQTTPETTSYSIALFDATDTANSSRPYFYEYHYTSPSFRAQTNNETEVNSSSVYNLGPLSQVLTVFSFLIAAGDNLWYDPVTKYLPQLNSTLSNSQIVGVDWSNILLIDLATQLSDIARDATLNSLGDSLPSGLASLLPSISELDSSNEDTRKQFFDAISLRRPIYQPATTPIYSNAAFQLLALALESITGQQFSTIMDKNIFSSLNMTSSFVGTPSSLTNAIIPVNASISGWQTPLPSNESALLAANDLFSTITDLSRLGTSILASTLLPQTTTNRWLKPHSYTSNSINSVGMPFDIYAPTLGGGRIGAVVPIFTKYGPNKLYSSYFGLVPDYGVGFVVLSADTNQGADLNAYVDYISELLIPALERAAAEQAGMNYIGNYTSEDGTVQLAVDVDGLGGLSVTAWSAGNASIDVRADYAELRRIPPATLDFRLYPTNLRDQVSGEDGSVLAFRAVFQDVDAPVDAGTPTCVTWEDGVDELVWNGVALDEFVFSLDRDGSAVGVSVPALGMDLVRG